MQDGVYHRGASEQSPPHSSKDEATCKKEEAKEKRETAFFLLHLVDERSDYEENSRILYRLLERKQASKQRWKINCMRLATKTAATAVRRR